MPPTAKTIHTAMYCHNYAIEQVRFQCYRFANIEQNHKMGNGKSYYICV